MEPTSVKPAPHESGARRVLVTGATGFTGSHVTKLLREEGYKVRALVRDKSRVPSFLTEDEEIELAEGSLDDASTLTDAVSQVSDVLHIAAAFRKANCPDSYFFKVNALGTKALLDASVAAGVKRFIHCSTVGVHSNSKVLPTDESAPYSPGDVYQRSKVEAEKTTLEYLRSGKIRGLVIRPGMIYGPGDMRTLKLFKMVAEQRFFYVGKGATFVHFVDVRDLARAFLLAMNRSELSGEVFIIAGERSVPLRQAVEYIASCFGVKPPALHIPVRPMQLLGTLCETVCVPLGIEPPLFRRRVDFFTKDRCFDVSKARSVLGFRPQQSFEAEIRDIIEWYGKHDFISVPAHGLSSSVQFRT
jgi:nucleoside-diphosphate-sugar epimerase